MARPEVVMVDGRPYSTSLLGEIRRPTPEPITVNTLTGLVDYWENNPDNIDLASSFIHVSDFRKAYLLQEARGEFYERNIYIAAEAPECMFRFNNWYDREEFMIAMQAFFCPTKTRDALLRVVGNVLQQAEIKTADDGITQRTTTRHGIARKEETDLPNPVVLKPYVTFCEIDQPDVQYVFRMREHNGGVECALFDADGNKYKLETALKIKKYLTEKIPNTRIIV
jgi:hypothetical protein